jgi:hypothetical protein
MGHLRADPGTGRQGREFGRQSVEHALHESVAQRTGFLFWTNETIGGMSRVFVENGEAAAAIG